MFRLRRYRAFLIFAVFVVIALYQFKDIRQWEQVASAGVERLRKPAGQSPPGPPRFGSPAHQDTTAHDNAAGKPAIDVIPQPAGAEFSPAPASGPETRPLPTSDLRPVAGGDAQEPSIPTPLPLYTPSAQKSKGPVSKHVFDEIVQQGKGRVEPFDYGSSVEPIYWSKLPEHFPVPSESVIALPTEAPKSLPKIQRQKFDKETSEAKTDRENKLEVIKEAFTHTWAGYKRSAWMHDELAPLSGGHRNPFCGWAATLVDSLDSLWILDLKDEFDAAVEAVNKIDFTTSLRADIPLFETVIRYLGGLLGAYDISGAKYRILLDKAVELAEVLMGAFDTPNRMPMTFYEWRPTFASQPHRARSRVVLAELGSLSLEFTRLAQLTKEPRYYDAIARITDALEIWQNNTRLPGLWPSAVDASGCKKESHDETLDTFLDGPEEIHKTPLVVPEPKHGVTHHPTNPGEKTASSKADDTTGHGLGFGSENAKAKRQVSGMEPTKGEAEASPAPDSGEMDGSKPIESARAEKPKYAVDPKVAADSECDEQGLASPFKMHTETFTIGGLADSLYEYLPKEYMLLGGVNEQYRAMYEDAVEGVKKYLLHRPMNKDERDVLFAGAVTVSVEEGEVQVKPRYDGSHLGCFAGGMFAVGAKIFNRKEDLDIASKLTDGCVWAYEATNSGIMPESFVTHPCPDQSNCAWNETAWTDALDPNWTAYREAQQKQQVLAKSRGSSPGRDAVAEDADSSPRDPLSRLNVAKRDVGTSEGGISPEKPATGPLSGGSDVKENPSGGLDKPSVGQSEVKPSSGQNEMDRPQQDAPSTTVDEEDEDTESLPPTHDEFVQSRIRTERLPPGFVKMGSKRYILRPEAIESVFIMYRVTGDDYWRRKGWKMFEAIQKHTRTENGHAAITDVTTSETEQRDSMESFWLAETLKYFYLLFSDPSVVSLDEYVLNTEAHTFRRPSAE